MIFGAAPLAILLLTAAGAAATPPAGRGDFFYAQAQQQLEIGTAESVQKARVLARRARAIFHEQKQNSREAEALFLLASSHLDQGDRETPSRIAGEISDLAHVSGDSLIEAKSLLMRSMIAHRKGELEDALSFAQSARRIYLARNHNRGLAEAAYGWERPTSTWPNTRLPAFFSTRPWSG